nr:hypothetical protein [Streptomyces cellostaticus]
MTARLVDEYRLLTFPGRPGRGPAAVPGGESLRRPGVPVGRTGGRGRPHPAPEGRAMTVRFLAL